MRAKQIIIPIIDKLDSLDIAVVSDLLETEVAKHAISHVKRKKKFLYTTPLGCECKIATSCTVRAMATCARGELWRTLT